MSRESHLRFRETLKGQFLWAIHLVEGNLSAPSDQIFSSLCRQEVFSLWDYSFIICRRT